MERLQFAVPTLFGLEGLCADEMRRLALPDVRAENGRVLCAGAAGDLPRLNLNLRTGERVLLVLGSFPARAFDQLFEGTKALPWEDFIPREGQFPVKGHSLNSQLHAVPACQAIVKKAVAARLGGKYGLNTLPDYRRQGVAAALMNALLDAARAEGRRGAALTCKQALIHYYEKFGYRLLGLSASQHGGAVWYDMLLEF